MVRTMLEHLVRYHKRYKDRSKVKRRRRILNAIVNGEPELDTKFIHHGLEYIKSHSYNLNSLSIYHRYLDKQVGRDVEDIHYDLSHRKVYRGNKEELRHSFSNDVQWGWNYCRGDDNCLERVPSKYQSLPSIELPGHYIHKGSPGGWDFVARVHVWYPYSHRVIVRVVIGNDIYHSELSNPSLNRKGWWGLYVNQYQEYKYEIVSDSNGRPLFTKEEYQIRVTDKHIGLTKTYVPLSCSRTIPVGGPLLREVIRIVSTYEWRQVPDWEVRLCGSGYNL